MKRKTKENIHNFILATGLYLLFICITIIVGYIAADMMGWINK